MTVPPAGPCPFCGFTGTAVEYSTVTHNARVHCGRCGAMGPIVMLTTGEDVASVVAAILAWNARR